jgi:hypothetical protein
VPETHGEVKMTALDMALKVLTDNNTVTPAKINDYVGKGNYASKYVLYLKLRGHVIETQKTGRTVSAYKYVGFDANFPGVNMKRGERRASKLLKKAAPVVTESEYSAIVKSTMAVINDVIDKASSTVLTTPEVKEAESEYSTITNDVIDIEPYSLPSDVKEEPATKPKEVEKSNFLMVPSQNTMAKAASKDKVTQAFGSSGALSSFSIDSDWDHAESYSKRDLGL